MQLQVSNICHVNNIFRARCLSPMYCVNLAETSHIHLPTINAWVQNSIIKIIACSCIIYDFSPKFHAIFHNVPISIIINLSVALLLLLLAVWCPVVQIIHVLLLITMTLY